MAKKPLCSADPLKSLNGPLGAAKIEQSHFLCRLRWKMQVVACGVATSGKARQRPRHRGFAGPGNADVVAGRGRRQSSKLEERRVSHLIFLQRTRPAGLEPLPSSGRANEAICWPGSRSIPNPGSRHTVSTSRPMRAYGDKRQSRGGNSLSPPVARRSRSWRVRAEGGGILHTDPRYLRTCTTY